MAEKGQPLPKFGEWDANNPASAEGFTLIFNKARNEKKTGGKVDSPVRADSKNTATLGKPQSESSNITCSSLQLAFGLLKSCANVIQDAFWFSTVYALVPREKMVLLRTSC